MGTRTSIVEINGRRYDAVSGRLMNAAANRSSTKSPAADGGLSIDGLQVAGSRVAPPLPPNRVSLAEPAHGLHHRHRQATTLARRSVHKKATIQLNLKPRGSRSADIFNPVPRPPAEALSPRHLRAKATRRHHAVRRFGTHHRKANHRPTPDSLTLSLPGRHRQAAGPPPPVPSMIASASHHRLQNMIEQALNSAEHHNFRQLKRPRRQRLPRIARAGTVALAGFVLIAFFSYQNLPNLSMRIAGSRSGVAARLPSYRPAGFTISGPILYDTNFVRVNFSARGDSGRVYYLTQQASDWNNQALVNGFLAARGYSYQAAETSGQTVYLYNDGGATWIKDGVWFLVEGSAGLSAEQLLRLAASS